MKKKYLAPLLYAATLWLVGLFIFGESGVMDTNFKNKEILRLKADILRSGLELDVMTKQYRTFKGLQVPDQAFLAGIDRKVQDIVVYKFPKDSDARRQAVSRKEEQRLMIQTAVMVGAFVLVGIISITALTFALKQNGGAEE